MAKTKTVFFCQNCGVDSPKWIGRCPSCKEWNTYVEEKVSGSGKKSSGESRIRPVPELISEISSVSEPRIRTHSDEFNRILGSGIVPGSVILLGGEPGIGKSTLALQIAMHTPSLKTLYISGEESNRQIKLRADRIGGDNGSCYILCETNLEAIYAQLQNIDPDVVIIDSVQTLQSDIIESPAGSVSQIRECTAGLLRFAKESATPVILIGHITKEGGLAGPKLLEHIVDVVLQFEGDHNHLYRILRSLKNRFGSTSEIGLYEMQSEGMREVTNPSELLITRHEEDISGVAIAATVDGMRPFLIEIQALVSSAAYGTPQRSSTGFDLRRLNMLLAVLEKRAGFRLAAKDVFLNIAGGLKVTDPAIDLAVISAILSSDTDLAIRQDICFAGEVGLSGEIRPVGRLDQRIGEAEKMGFTKMIVSSFNKKTDSQRNYKIEVLRVGKVEDLFRLLFSNRQKS
ncbi:MAG: DNA repair protein RadA [Bacteroidales bacterium]